MSIVTAILCGILYWLAEANLPFVGLWTLQRPLVCGFITGCFLGDPVTGAVVGGTINLVYLGFISAGGSMPADMALAGVLGTAYAITGNLDANTALAIAVPLGLLGTIVWYLRMTIDSVFVHMGDRWVAQGKFNHLYLSNVILPQIFSAVICVVPCTLAAYFGADYIQSFIEMCAGKPLQIFEIIGGLMPALGIAITLQYIFKGEARIFLFLGFMISTCFGLTLIQQGIIGLIAALIYIQVTDNAAPAVSAAGSAPSGEYDPDYDPDDE
ncbi:MAG: PTS sugar transporter subunit IIC [Butyricicoccus sp.]|uniref:PTS mannose/fructose/sorbose/N-acetylgalactosamine transporter subunit IIC n=1 Tax=Intestinibacillus sp. Marseille-P6563 TaxID=2364792 RepID=UPI000F046BCC|nr:PTS sugar transporter subunit IIC [Intestinibacillus sp. Marseille-P6563]MDR3766002.1 PTS sugar transporter subunit IIC [Butyricicoccus sp.]